jgi:WD40-like Beta Propeller Repeat
VSPGTRKQPRAECGGARPALAIGAVLLLVVVAPGEARGASRFDPALRFRVTATEHFVIYFHQREERAAQRLAAIAEETWRALQRPLGVRPPLRTHVVLADQSEVANGYATPLPYDTIVIYTMWPSGAEFDFDDWLRLAFTHEFTHIVHLDRSEGWSRAVRSIFGRSVFAFPNLFLPPWQVEGLAVYEESIITGQGRLHAGDFRAIVDEAAREGRLEPLDRVNGATTDWPGGAGVYSYGVGFHQYLADRFGADTLAAMAEATARRLPYLASGAFRKVYGESLGDLWRDYESSVTAAVATPNVSDAGITRLTHQGFSISGPRFDPDACTGCPLSIVYSAVNPRGFPALYRVGADGADPEQLATRYLGSSSAVGRDGIYFDQLELRRNIGLYGDLYLLSRADGRVHQLTSETRLQDPDLSPDGSTLVCVQNRPGHRDLVLVPLKPDTTSVTPAGSTAVSGFSRTVTITPLIAEPDIQFDGPKWSPDGRSIAVERHRLDGAPEIVVVDVATKAVRVVAASPRTRFTTPAWRPDGMAVVAAVAAEEQTFNLFEFSVDGTRTRQLTHTTGGALWPDVSPDGKTLVFVGYTIDGYDLFSMPYPDARADTQVGPDIPPVLADPRVGPDNPLVGADLRVRPTADTANTSNRPTFGYSPLDTLKPTSWTPVIETGGDQVRIGAGIDGYDVLGYHAYAATATWLVSSPTGASRPSAAAPDWNAYYLYDRWRPTIFLSATSDTSFFAGPATDAGAPTPATRRDRQFEGGVLFPIRHTRVQHSARLSMGWSVADFTLANGLISRDRTPIRATWQTVTAHSYGYSISPEGGIAGGATIEVVRRSLGSFADATTTTADLRAYIPGFAPHHVIALRAGGGASNGDSTVGRTFLLGGDFPGAGVTDLGSSAFSLLRGFAANSFAGSRVAIANAEYRWPIARPQRGRGTWPLFLHTLHAAVFVDTGETWTRSFERSAIKSSAGAQISADAVAGFFAPFTVTIGAAVGHDGSSPVPNGHTAYVRIGKAF